MTRTGETISRRALRLAENEAHPLYLLALTPADILKVAEVSRISRDSMGKLIGYQRTEVRRHVREIVDYLNEQDIIFPNSIILALSSNVRFKSSRGPNVFDGLTTAGTLEISVPEGGPKPGFIVDGQQRTYALSKANREGFPVPVSAFIADSVGLQRDQFLRVNNTKPLPRGLVTELLPEVSTLLPPKMAANKLPSAICDLLNRSEESPFCGMIRRASSSREEKKKATITDTTVVAMIRESLSSTSGSLFPYRNIATGETDMEGIWRVLITYWSAVRDIFSKAWALSPRGSRLVHGVGIHAMGRLMDKVMSFVDPHAPETSEAVRRDLEIVAPCCRWTSGVWGHLEMRWNELQNVPRHKRMLANYLIRVYVQGKRVNQ